MANFEAVGEVRCRVGEGPTWVADRSQLWWVDLPTGIWHVRDWSSGETTSRRVSERLSVVLPAPGDAAAYAAIGKQWAIVDDQGLRLVATVEADIEDTFINDARTGPDGRLYFGTFDRRRRDGVCGLYRLDHRGPVRIADDIVISNGMDWSPSGDEFYVVDSHREHILAFDFDDESGTVAHRRVLVELDQADGMPDGMTVDADGDLWVAMYGGGAVLRYDRTGRLVSSLRTPVAYPTSCEFAGPDVDTLVVTSGFARIVDAGDQPSNVDGAVFVCNVGVVGQPSRNCELHLTSGNWA